MRSLFPGLGEYEGIILFHLIKKGRTRVRELMIFCTIPRTKIYSSFDRLVEAGLIIIDVKSDEEVGKPDIWEYWTESKQKSWRSKNEVGVQHYTPNLENIKSLWAQRMDELTVLGELIQEAINIQKVGSKTEDGQ